jgi:small subunit ribosomal protein S6
LNQYEAMYLFDPTFGGSHENCEAEIRRIMGRAEAELLFCKRWDERRLAYKLKGRKRGVYVLTFFKSDPTKIGGIERDVRISENILRVLVLRADGITPDLMEKASIAKTEPAEGAAGEGGYREGGDGGYDSRPRRRSPRREESVGAPME